MTSVSSLQGTSKQVNKQWYTQSARTLLHCMDSHMCESAVQRFALIFKCGFSFLRHIRNDGDQFHLMKSIRWRISYIDHFIMTIAAATGSYRSLACMHACYSVAIVNFHSPLCFASFFVFTANRFLLSNALFHDDLINHCTITTCNFAKMCYLKRKMHTYSLNIIYGPRTVCQWPKLCLLRDSTNTKEIKLCFSESVNAHSMISRRLLVKLLNRSYCHRHRSCVMLKIFTFCKRRSAAE